MLDEMLLTTTLCVAIDDGLALFNAELELLQQPLDSQLLVPTPSRYASWEPIDCTSSSGAGLVTTTSA